MRHALHKVTSIVGFFMALNLINGILTQNARGSYELTDALTTVGISTGVGTVLGLSTLPFYSQPPLSNVLIGAGAGMLVGIGVASYLLGTSTDSVDDIDYNEIVVPKKKDDENKQPPSQHQQQQKQVPQTNKNGAFYKLFKSSVPVTFALQPAVLSSALRDRGWAVGLQVLALRF